MANEPDLAALQGKQAEHQTALSGVASKIEAHQ
jgi:hypothetical protein